MLHPLGASARHVRAGISESRPFTIPRVKCEQSSLALTAPTGLIIHWVAHFASYSAATYTNRLGDDAKGTLYSCGTILMNT